MGEGMSRSTTVGYTPAIGLSRRRGFATTITVFVALTLLVGVFMLGRVTVPAAVGSTAASGDTPMHGGVPIPNRHSIAGAATAAADYQIAGFRVSAGALDPTLAAAVLLAPNANDAAKQVLAASTTGPDQLSKARTSYAPLSLVMQSYNASQAVVQVWGVATSSTLVTPQPAGTEDWSRSTVTMMWNGTQWRVTDQHFAAGPWPARDTDRMVSADGDFSFRYNELAQGGWSYVPEP